MAKRKEKEKARICSFRMPVAERIEGVPYLERGAIYCACGTTIFGNSKEDAQDTWLRHVEEAKYEKQGKA